MAKARCTTHQMRATHRRRKLLLDRGAGVSARNGKDPFRLVFREILRKDKKEIGKALLATMRARTARLEAENADLKARLARYETNR